MDVFKWQLKLLLVCWEENNCNGATYSLLFNSKNDLIHAIWTEKYQTEIALEKRKRISDVYMCSTDVLGYRHDEWWCIGSATIISLDSFASVVLSWIFSSHSQLKKRKVSVQCVTVIDRYASLMWPFHRGLTFSLYFLLCDHIHISCI